MSTRPAAVAGLFYPQDAEVLEAMVSGFLQQTSVSPVTNRPKVLVVPHAGYIYSGQAAADAYALLEPIKDSIKKVVLLGPCHRVPVHGIALPTHDAFSSPLGDVVIDSEAIEKLCQLPFVSLSDEAHALEHSLEVHLPFLQSVLADFSVLPLVVGECGPADVTQVLEQVWGGDETLIVVSTDLSHFLPYDVANEIDQQTADKILQLRSDLQGEEACGCRSLNGLLQLAKQKGLHCEQVSLCNSGDTAGDKDRVVGYGSFVLN